MSEPFERKQWSATRSSMGTITSDSKVIARGELWLLRCSSHRDGILSYNHRMIERFRVGRDLKDHLIATPLLRAGLPPTRSGGVGPHPILSASYQQVTETAQRQPNSISVTWLVLINTLGLIVRLFPHTQGRRLKLAEKLNIDHILFS